jgi:hypothetical protein
MSQSFDLTGPSVTTHVQFNGADCEKVMLNGTRIWERYIAQQQVWVTSGYNSTTNVFLTTVGSWWTANSGRRWMTHGFTWGSNMSWRTPYGTWNNSYTYNPITLNGYYMVRGGNMSGVQSGSYAAMYIHVYTPTTTWVDTSSYQTQNVTAYYY